MRKILTSSDANYISTVYQYLRQSGIPVSVNEQGDKLELWLQQSSYEAIAKQKIAELKADPSLLQQSAPRRKFSFAPDLLRNTGWVTRVVAAAAIMFYLLLQLAPDTILAAFKISPFYQQLPFSQPWRFISPVLLHFSLMHLVFNVFWWWYLGGRIETHLGASWLVAVLLFSGITANVIQYLVSGPNFGGLSGVVYGLLGFCWLYSMGRRTPLWLPPGLIIFMVGWLVLGYTDILWVNIANEAHLAGLLSGCLCGVVVRQLNPTAKTKH